MIAAVKEYARLLFKQMNRVEWSDGFNFENIPKNLLSSRYHVELGEPASTKVANDNQEVRAPLTVRAFLAPGPNPKLLIDQGAALADTIIGEFVAAENRVTQQNVKNVIFNSMAIEPLDESNDNGIIIKMEFDVLIVIATN